MDIFKEVNKLVSKIICGAIALTTIILYFSYGAMPDAIVEVIVVTSIAGIYAVHKTDKPKEKLTNGYDTINKL